MVLTLTEVEKFAALLSDAALESFAVPTKALNEKYHHKFCQFAWQCLPLFIDRLKTWMEVSSIHDLQMEEIRSRSIALETLSKEQESFFIDYIKALETSDIEYCLIKGTAAKYTAHQQPLKRAGIDIDIAVQKKDRDRAYAIANDFGFVQSVWLENEKKFVKATYEEKELVVRNHYEMGYLIRRQRPAKLTDNLHLEIKNQLSFMPNPWHLDSSGVLALYLNLDIHFGISLDIGVNDILLTKKAVDAGFGKIYVPETYWQMFHLIYKIYWEGVHNYLKGVYQYADLIRLAKIADERDWENLFKLLRNWQLEAAGFYVLSRLNQNFLLDLPTVAAVLREFHKANNLNKPVEENNLGDMWPKLWGFR